MKRERMKREIIRERKKKPDDKKAWGTIKAISWVTPFDISILKQQCTFYKHTVKYRILHTTAFTAQAMVR